MEDLRELLATKAFWFFYQAGEEHELDEATVRRFTVPDDSGDWYEPIVFRLECAAPYVLELDVLLHYYTTNLLLTNDFGRYQLGWWDDARWHPFALRWVELQQLLRYWKDHPPSCELDTASALLLLARFVGNGQDEMDEFPARQEQVAVAYHKLGLFSSDEIRQLVECTILKPTEDDHRWARDEALGWVFGGEYSCYSLRNLEHADGCGTFPFAEFAQLLAELDT